MSDGRRRWKTRPWRWKTWALLILAPFVAVYFFAGPYVFPVSWGLGPCLKDWTSPSSYLPRASPLVTVDGPFTDAQVRVCYGAPSARGRVLFGADGLVPFGEYWRTGANEPTRLFTNQRLRLGDVTIEPGRYSLYTVPAAVRWEVVVNRSTFHWGYDFSDGVVAQEVGRTQVEVEPTTNFEELFRIYFGDGGARLVVSWGDVAVPIPLEVLR